MDDIIIDSIKPSELLSKVNDLVFNSEDIFEVVQEFRAENVTPHISIGENETKTLDHCIDVLRGYLSTTHDNVSLFLSSAQRSKVEDAIYILKNTLSAEFSNLKFYKFLCCPDVFSLELLWKFQENGLVTMEIFLRECLGQARTLALFSRSLASLCLNKHSNEEIKMAILAGIMPSLVMCAFSLLPKSDIIHEKNIQQVCKVILESLLQRLTYNDSISSHHTSTEKHSINIIQILCDSPFIEISSLQAFCIFALNYLLSHNPITKVAQAVSEQHKWSFKRSNPNFVSIIQKILTVLSPDNVMSSLKRALESKEVNWKALLTVISVFLICTEEASLLLQGLIEELLKEAFNKLEMDNLISTFLIARQCSLEGPHFFLSYENWLQKHFGDSEKSLINNSRTFNFFITFLTNIVPYEPVYCLRVHLFKPPHIPQKYKQLYNDYITLVKTRMHDLKENSDHLGIYGHVSRTENSKTLYSSQAETDVERALQLYESTGKIPSSIYQASIFHKVYFNSQFLPFLLAPRPLPDVPDLKMKFIEELKKLGKIPSTLYNSYKKDCETETFKLLEGVIMDENFDEEMIEPNDHLLTSVSSFCKSLELNSESGNICSMISQLSNSLQSLLEQPSEISQDIILNEDLDNNSLHSQVSSSLLEAFIVCSRLAGCTCTVQKNTWDVLFVSMISSYPVLHRSFFLQLWKQMKHVENMESLALLILRITEMGSRFNKVSKDKSSTKLSLCDAIFENFKVNTFQLMSKFIQFSTTYLKLVISGNNVSNSNMIQLIPYSLVTKFQFVAVRLCSDLRCNLSFESDCTEYYDSTLEIYNSQLIQNRLKECQLTLKQWLSFEIEVQPEKDNLKLHESCTYLHWCVHCMYLPLPLEKGGCGGSIERACSDIFSAVIATNGDSASFCRILLLLQELTSSLVSSKTDDLPWLLQEFKFKFEDEVSSIDIPMAVDLQCQLHVFFRIAHLLSPYLFFSNTTNSISRQSLNFVQSVVNGYLKAYLVENYSLSSYLTLYFWKGIVLLYRIEESRPQLENFLNCCPLLMSSMITHWNIMGPLLSQMISGTCQCLLSDILKNIKSWIGEMSVFSILRCHNYFAQDKWVIGLILAQRLKLYSSTGILPLSNADTEVLSMAFHFTVAEITSHLIKNEEFQLDANHIVIEIMKNLALDEYSCTFLKPQFYNSTVLKDVLSPTVLHLHSAGLLFIFLQLGLPDYQKVCSKNYSYWLTAILVNLNEFVQKIDSFYGKLYNSHIALCQASQISNFYLGVRFLCKVKEIMSNTPASVLKLIPREILHCYETDIMSR